MQVVGGVFGQVKRPQPREEHVHFAGRLGIGRQLEDDVDAVDAVLFKRLPDEASGRNQRHRSARGHLAKPGIDLAARALRQRGAELKHRPPQHGRAGQDVLLGHLLHEAVRGQDGDVSGGDGGVVDDPAYAAEMINVRVAIDDGGHRPLAAMLTIERECRSRRLRRNQGVDDDDAAIALDDRHIGDVEAAHLVDALAYAK